MMPLLHGIEISADEVEAEIARWSAERFAQLCNAVAWASPNVTGWRQTIPVFTERVHVADNGIDAEWQRVLTAAEAPTPPEQLLRPGLNVFQYKKHRQQAREIGLTSCRRSSRSCVGLSLDVENFERGRHSPATGFGRMSI